ncbi:MAG: P-II family nitrogen regulator [Chloroflexi bacterium]|nr:P-II family nitrogen regulator [Chloroflexota bacterium]
MNKIEAIIRPERLDNVKDALAEAGFNGLNVTHVTGRGRQKGIAHQGRSGERYQIDMLPKVKLEVVVPDAQTEKAVKLILTMARTGNVGDGKVFVSAVAEAYRVRTGEQGEEVL